LIVLADKYQSSFWRSKRHLGYQGRLLQGLCLICDIKTTISSIIIMITLSKRLEHASNGFIAENAVFFAALALALLLLVTISFLQNIINLTFFLGKIA